jgi:hypothetical protein
MTRGQVAILAARIAALWLMVGGLGTAASFLLITWPTGRDARQTMIPAALMFGVLPIVAGFLIWNLAEPLAARMFRDKPEDGTPHPVDLYRVAAAFAGLLLVGGAIPRLALWVSYLLLSFETKSTLLGPVGLQAEQRAMLFGIQTQAAAVSTFVQLGLGLVFLVSPERVSRAIASLRREPIGEDAPVVPLGVSEEEDSEKP